MISPGEENETVLWKMYMWSAVQAISEEPEADGVVILKTAQNREFRFPFFMNRPTAEWSAHIRNVLIRENSACIRNLVYVWKNHWLDIPADDLRKELISLCPENQNAQIMLIGEDGFVIKKLSQICGK